MTEYQKQVVQEKAELDARREKVMAFERTEEFTFLPPMEQDMLNAQRHVMAMYSAILGERIAAFSKA